MNQSSGILAQLHRVSPISLAASEAMHEIIQCKGAAKGDMLVRLGQIPRYFYFIDKGLARVYYKRNNKDITDYFAIDGQFIGALPALFLETASHKAIEVLEESTIQYFDYGAFEELCLRHHDLERAARKMMIYAMLQGQQRIESIRFLSAQERYHELEKLYPGITNRAPLKHIASYLGTTQVSLSRIRAGKQ